jgi:hypothetical protein
MRLRAIQVMWEFEEFSWRWHPRLDDFSHKWRQANCAREWDTSLLKLAFGA